MLATDASDEANMARCKVTREIAAAFHARKARTIGNTHTDGNAIYLHGNKIVERQPNGTVRVTLAGWNTITTRERLRPFVDIYVRDGVPYIDGRAIDSRGWITVG